MFKKLTAYQLAELWSAIEYQSNTLSEATKRQDTVGLYRALDELDTLRRKLQRHHAAVAIERGEKAEKGA